MYGIRPHISWEFLIGQKLIQLAIGEHDYQLEFSGEISISVTGNSEISHANKRTKIQFPDLGSVSKLHVFIGQSISNVSVIDDLRLSVEFSNQGALTLIDSCDQYESFVIWNRGDFIAV